MATSGAELTHDHESGRMVRPTLANIGAARFFAHRMETKALHDPARLQVLLRPRRPNLKPGGFYELVWAAGYFNRHK